MIYDLDQLGKFFHVTEKTIREWVDGGMPVVSHGKQGTRKKTRIDLEAAIEWYFANNYEKVELERSRTRLANEQAESAKIKNEQQRGDTVSLRSVVRQVSLALSTVRTNVLAVPTKLAPILEHRPAAEIKAELEREILACLEAITDFDIRKRAREDFDGGDGSDAGLEATSQVNGKRVGG